MIWLACPLFADEFVRGKVFEGLEPSGKIMGIDEIGEVVSQLGVIVIVESFDGRLLDGSVHALYLPVRPGMLHSCQMMLDAVLVADAIEDVVEGVFVAGVIGELENIMLACLYQVVRLQS